MNVSNDGSIHTNETRYEVWTASGLICVALAAVRPFTTARDLHWPSPDSGASPAGRVSGAGATGPVGADAEVRLAAGAATLAGVGVTIPPATVPPVRGGFAA
ncbi:MAG: hypothetical protein ACYC1E_04385 [Propionibacteriaceae bacterium]